jgi:hypothetical protein
MPDDLTSAAESAPDPDHRHRARITRLPVVAVIAALLAVGLVAGRGGARHPGSQAPAAQEEVAAPAAALSSSWFCAGATDTRTGAAPGEIVVTNAGRFPVGASVTVLGSNGTTRHQELTVGADDRQIVAETVAGSAPWTGATVDLDGGDVTVEQQITSPLGTTASPCATAGSDAWYFATGATRINASSEITLLNPYPSAAIVDLGFTTNEGQEAPAQFSPIVVPAEHLVAVDLGSHLRRRSAIATSVTVTDGRVVAWKTDIVSRPRRGVPLLGSRAARRPDADPASPVLGVTAVLGAPGAQTVWRWPEGSTAAGVGEQYVVYNPGSRPADVALTVRLDDTSVSAEPFDLTLGPQETTTITTGDEARIPAGSGYSVGLTSTNGIPVVAERTVSETAPSPYRGIGETFGSTQSAPEWLVGAGVVSRHSDEILAVSNPGRAAVRVQVQALGRGRLSPIPGQGAGTVTVPGGARVEIDLGVPGVTLAAAILVHASGPVVVQRDLYGRRGTPGVSLSLGVPLSP